MRFLKYFTVMQIFFSIFFPLRLKSQSSESGKSGTLSVNRDSEDYLGQPDPGLNPALFAPGRISTRYNERDLAISPDGGIIFYSLQGPGFFSLIMHEKKDRIWQEPKVASFSGKYSDLEPCSSPALAVSLRDILFPTAN